MNETSIPQLDDLKVSCINQKIMHKLRRINKQIAILKQNPALSSNKQIVDIETTIQECNHALETFFSGKNSLPMLIVDAIYYKILKKINENPTCRRIKSFLSPKLGKLYLYHPTRFTIPKTYQRTQQTAKVPRISIITPSYNQSPFIERTINSVLSQRYDNLEYIIQDGGSTDDTVSILKKYTHSLHSWESKKDSGQSHALNLGFKQASGEIMAYLNSDDILLPGTLHYVARYFMKHPNVDVIYGHRVLINEDDQEIGRWVLPRHENEILKWADYIPQETLFWRRSIWDKVGGHIDENFQFAMDWDLILRFQAVNAKFVRLPRFLGAFRIHTQQKTATQISSTGIQEMQRLRERAHGRSVHYTEVSKKLRGYLFRHWIVHRLYKAGFLSY